MWSVMATINDNKAGIVSIVTSGENKDNLVSNGRENKGDIVTDGGDG